MAFLDFLFSRRRIWGGHASRNCKSRKGEGRHQDLVDGREWAIDQVTSKRASSEQPAGEVDIIFNDTDDDKSEYINDIYDDTI